MWRTLSSGNLVETLPPADHIEAARALLDLFPDEWHAVAAQAQPRQWVPARGDPGHVFPHGYGGFGFAFFDGDGQGARYAAFMVNDPRQLVNDAGLRETYLGKVRHALATTTSAGEDE